MDFEGYVDRIAFHFERLDVTERPTQQEYIDAWNNQIPAKKMAQSFARRLRRGKKTETDPPEARHLQVVGVLLRRPYPLVKVGIRRLMRVMAERVTAFVVSLSWFRAADPRLK